MSRFEAVIFDWAGTLIDFGSFAPMGAFVEAFARFGVSVSIADARGPMGAPKRDHIRAMMALPHVAEGWRAVQGSAPDEAAIDRLYEVFVPLNAGSRRARHARLAARGGHPRGHHHGLYPLDHGARAAGGGRAGLCPRGLHLRR